MIYAIGNWTADFASNELACGGRVERVTPKSMCVLRLLVALARQPVSRECILEDVWAGTCPTNEVVTQAIAELRRILGADARDLIETIPRIGYRLNADPRRCDGEARRAEAPARAAPRSPRWRRWHAAAAAALVAAIAIAASVRRDPDVAVHAPLVLTADAVGQTFPSIAPDGSRVVYAAAAADRPVRLESRALVVGAGAFALTAPDDADDLWPVFSPDGRWIAFQRAGAAGCRILIVPATGGDAKEFARCTQGGVQQFDWLPGGDALIGSGRGAAGLELMRIDRAGVAALDYAPRAPTQADLAPRVSPDGRWIAFRRGAAPYADLFVVPVDGGQVRQLTTLGAEMLGHAWQPDSAAVIFSSDHEGRRSLYAVQIDDGAVAPLHVHDAILPSVARGSGTVVYVAEDRRTRLSLRDRDGTVRALTQTTRSDFAPQWSPDGRRLAYLSTRSGSQELWLSDGAGDGAPLTAFGRGVLSHPQWSPDSTQLLVVRRLGASSRLLRVDAATARVAEVAGHDERVRFGSFAADGEHVYYVGDRGGGWDAWRLSSTGARERLTTQGAIDVRDFGDPDAVYYVRETAPGLFRLDLHTREERRVIANVGDQSVAAIARDGDMLRFVDARRGPRFGRLCAMPLASLRRAEDAVDCVCEAEPFPAGPRGQLSVRAGDGSIAYTVLHREDVDLAAFELQPRQAEAGFRAAALAPCRLRAPDRASCR